MPTYDFECEDCKKEFTVSHSIKGHDPNEIRCPHCGSKNVERLWRQVYAVTSKKS